MFEEFSVLNFFIIFFGFCAIITVVVFVGSIYLARAKKQAQQDEKGTKQKEIIKEIVMVPCVYCGSLMPQTTSFCSTCGAGRKA